MSQGFVGEMGVVLLFALAAALIFFDPLINPWGWWSGLIRKALLQMPETFGIYYASLSSLLQLRHPHSGIATVIVAVVVVLF
jgi:hypothetical protein